jgi:hypothetical protein
MTKHIVKTALIVSLIVFLSGSASAGLIHVTLGSRDFNDLFSGSENAIGTPMITDVSGGDILGNEVSQVFTDGNGNYAYLYQLNNTGDKLNDVFQAFTVSPFAGANANTVIGYLTANAPTGFTLGQQMPYSSATVNANAGPTISFSFSDLLDCAIDPGESSYTLYVLSTRTPGVVTGNVIDGYTHSGNVVGPVTEPVPEPGTCILLATGLIGLLIRIRKKRNNNMSS